MTSLETLILGFLKSKMTESKLLVKTTLGTTILDLESRVNVHLNKNVYLEKQAIDLNAGDSVIYQKEYIQTTLDEVDPLLELAPRYMHAKRQITEKNNSNNYVPLLRTNLWRGFLAYKKEYNDSLESIIKKEAQDFGDLEYDEALGCINNLLCSDGIEMSQTSIRNWLKGDTYAPREWKIFNSLSKINPIFNEFNENDRGFDGRYYNYKFFVIARQTVMRTLARLKGIEFKGQTQELPIEKEDRWKIRLDDEIGIVVRSLMEDKGKDYALARIVSVEKLHPKHPSIRAIKKNPEDKLSRGIETNKAGLEIRKKGLIEFLDDFFAVNSLFSHLTDSYIDSHYKKEFEPFIVKDGKGNIKGYSEGLKHLFLARYNEPESYKSGMAFQRMQNLLELNSEKIIYSDKLAELLVADVFSGRIDGHFKIQRDSFKKLLEAEYKLRAARPRIFSEQEIALDNFENCCRQFKDCLAKKYPEDSNEYSMSQNRINEAREAFAKINKRIESRFPVKCHMEYNGEILLTYLKYDSKEKRPLDAENLIQEYDLEPFRGIITKNESKPQNNLT